MATGSTVPKPRNAARYHWGIARLGRYRVFYVLRLTNVQPILAGLAEARQLIGPELRLFLFIGILGGFTTFSTFGYETFGLLQDGEHLRAAVYVGIHLLLVVFAVWGGYAASGLL